MVYDGAVKDQESSSGPASAALSEASGASAAASEALVSARPARPAQDRRLGVRHPLKYRRFRAGGKMTVEPGGLPSSQTVVQGEEEEEESSEVEEVEEEASSAEMQMQPRDVEVSSAPAQVVEEMAEVVEEMEVEGSEMDVSPEAAVAVGDTELEAQPDEEEEVSSVVVAEGDRKQEASAAASVPAVEAPNEKDQEKGREEKEREKQKERERVDEVGYMSGGWKSADGSLSCGYSSFRGKRASMEDFYDIKSSKIDETQISLFGIFDGHGGSRAAEYLKEHLFENLMKHQEFMTDTKLAISETYKKTDSEFLDAERNSHRDDGSTASTAVLVGDHLYVANVGDSRAVISKAGKGTWRVGGVLAMSRAFGNRLLKQFVIADPEIQEQEVNDELEFLIIASDGLWDVVPNEDAVSLVKMEEEPEAAARKLTETAFSRGSGDNITCIVVKFQHDKMGGDSPPSGD
ncbi:probable protein phosphatase 2C 52 isoform X2 [Phragmites australis]|uniref:probable protein phosphatase 2C 52 isoform X2 n=1 Tax=Phragmites australis TaxID=29695 RepID=UPI002D79B9E0|nr:probable protein phosphatase 2C 52 isoform X2 [Phragmites australis]